MPDLQGFLDATPQNATQRVASDPCLVLADQQDSSPVRWSRRARWVQRFRSRENSAVVLRFLRSLQASYGEESAGVGARSSGLRNTLSRSGPLRARQVTAAVEAAKSELARIRGRNAAFAQSYVENLERERSNHPLIQAVIESAAHQHPDTADSIANILDRCGLPLKVFRAILESSEQGIFGCHSMTWTKADAICIRIIRRELGDAFARAFHRRKNSALKALNPTLPDTIAYQELQRAFDRLEPSIDLGCEGLSPDAAKFFVAKAALAIDTGEIHCNDLEHEESLRELARDTAERFVDERMVARNEVAKLDRLGPDVQAALREYVTRDIVPPNIVAHLGKTCLQVAKHLDVLAHLSPPCDLEESIETIRESLASCWKLAGVNIKDNEELYYRYAWRFLLAPGGPAQARAIVAQLVPETSLLRGIGEAADWYTDGFEGTRQAAMTFTDEGSGQSRNIHNQRSFHDAHDYSLLIRCLRNTLLEITGEHVAGGIVRRQNPCPTDQTVATMRNLGIPFPAPERLNCCNEDVPFSHSTLAQMRVELERQVRRSRRIHSTGLTANCWGFLRSNEMTNQRQEFKARFTINGKTLPVRAKAGTVALELRKFCQDRKGNVNQHLLANISRVVHVATFRSLYLGCMNPDRPDLSIMNGYPEGAFAGHSYSLRRNADGDVELEVSEKIVPLMHCPMHQNDVRPASGAKPGGAAPKGVRLSGHNSHFLTRASIHFNPASFKPQLHSVNIGYRLEKGDTEVAELPFWIPRPVVPEAPQSADDTRRGQQYAHVEPVEWQHSSTPESISANSGEGLYERIGPPGHANTRVPS